MADYWKSQAKKFCDFCKCWIADNKPSVEFHEKGKRHKENVEKRLKEMTKRSCKDHSDTMKVEHQIKKMEEAALKAYMKDVEENRDYSSMVIKEQANKRGNKRVATEKEAASSSAAKEEVYWYEAKSDEGHTYYWHKETGESLWESPGEPFVTIAEQEEIKAKQAKEDLKKAEEEKIRKLDEAARIEREKQRKRSAKQAKKPIVPFEAVMGPAPRGDPYGKWKTIRPDLNEPVDYQLPQSNQNTVQVRVPSSYESEPKIKFKEKTMPSVDRSNEDDIPQPQTDFKKRKLNASTKRNTRQRGDQDD